MPLIFNGFFVAIVFISTVLIPIISFIAPIITRKGQIDIKVKERLQKTIIISLGLGLVVLLTLFALAPIFPQTPSSPPSGTLLYHFIGHQLNEIEDLAWSPDDERIATVGTLDGTIQVWDALTGDHLLTYQPPSTHTNSLVWSPDGKYIAVNIEQQLSILEVNSSLLHRVFVLPSPLLSSKNGVIAWSSDGTRIALACSDHVIRIWNVINGQLNTQQKPLTYTSHSKDIYALTWSPDGQYIASASLDDIIQIWNINAGNKAYQTIHTTASQFAANSSNIVWSPDGNRFASENGDGIVHVWVSKTGKEQGYIETNLPAGAVAWSPNGQDLALGRWDNRLGTVIQIFSYDGGQVIDGLYGGTFTSGEIAGPPQALAWSHNGNYIAAADVGGHGVFVWQSRGTYISAFQSISQGEDPSLSLLKFGGICYGIVLGGSVVYASLSPKKKPFRSKQKATRGATIRSILGNIVLYLLAFCLGLFFCSPIVEVLSSTGHLSITPLASIVGFLLLESYILPSLVKRYVLPARTRRHLLARSRQHLQQADMYAQQGDDQQAMKEYDRALLLNPNNIVASMNRAQIYTKMGEYRWAVEDYNGVLAQRTNDSSIYYRRAMAYSAAKEYKKAIEDYTQAAELKPDQADIYYKRAIASLWLNNIPQARVDYLHASDLDPQNIDAAWKVVWLLMGKQRPGLETAQHLESIATTDPQSDIAHICRAVALGLQNKVHDGLRELEHLLQKSQSCSDAYFWKAMLFIYFYADTSRAPEVEDILQHALNTGLSPALLTPLYWLEKDKPNAFKQYAEPLLVSYNIK